MKPTKWLFLLFLFTNKSYCQDTLFARQMIDTLSSEYFFGRGYTKDGLKNAALFLSEQFRKIGLSPMHGTDYFQEFSFSVNTFPGIMDVKINGKQLRPGHDFIVVPESRAIKGKFELEQGDSIHFINQKGKLIVSLEDKLTWSVSDQEADYTALKILKSAIRDKPAHIELDIENKLIRNFKTENVCGMVKGLVNPDSVILFTAHYDHLGGMGRETFFPGANDNASGIAMLLGLASWFVNNPQPYSIGFICFSGEEAGLKGSEYFVNHPLLAISNIRFLTNLDLTGTGVEGITVVNATEFPSDYSLLKSINEKYHLLPAVNSRGKAKNSDHYWFTEKGVPSFFIYTLGGIKAYHDVHDISATLPNNEYIDLFTLLKRFSLSVMNKEE